MLDVSRPGKPTDNAFIESLNGSFLDEYLNVNWFMSLDDAMEKIQAFKDLHNALKPFLKESSKISRAKQERVAGS